MPSTISDLHSALRRLAEWPASQAPVVSAYLDLRPQATGQNPQVRSGLVVLRDRLREIERELEPRSAAHDSLVADVERLDRYITDEALPEAQCLALFACHEAGDLFEALGTRRELDNEVTAGTRPRVLPLARLADEDTAVVALADTNTLRLFARRSGGLEEVGLLDDETDDYRRAAGGGWSQGRFQRHVDEHREAFAQLAAQAIEEVAEQQDAAQLVLCADEVASTLLTEALSKPLAERVRGVLRLDTTATIEQVEAEVMPFLEEIDAADREDAADRLVGAVRSGGLGVAGAEASRKALELGQVGELLLDPSAQLGEDAGEEIVRLALATDARVRFPADHGGLRKLGGVGGLLRFALDRDVSEPQSDPRSRGAAVSG